MSRVDEQERGDQDQDQDQDEDQVGRVPLPEPPTAPDRVVTGIAEPGGSVSARRHRVRRAQAVLRARRERIRDDTHKNRVYRAAVGVVGGFVVLLGLVLVPLPGPGWLVVFLGLALLGTEFSSAQRLRHFGERQVQHWTRWVAERSVATRAALGTGTVAAVAAVAWGYLAWRGLPAWTPEVVTAQLQWVPGL